MQFAIIYESLIFFQSFFHHSLSIQIFFRLKNKKKIQKIIIQSTFHGPLTEMKTKLFYFFYSINNIIMLV
jgi:hypothetical protein